MMETRDARRAYALAAMLVAVACAMALAGAPGAAYADARGSTGLSLQAHDDELSTDRTGKDDAAAASKEQVVKTQQVAAVQPAQKGAVQRAALPETGDAARMATRCLAALAVMAACAAAVAWCRYRRLKWRCIHGRYS